MLNAVSSPSEAQASSIPFGDLAQGLAILLKTAATELEGDRAVAKASLARARSLVQIAIDRHGDGSHRGTCAGGLTGWQAARLRAFIEERLDRTITIKDLSGVVRRSPAHFSRSFRRSFGQSPHAYLVERRVRRAGDLMIAGDAPLREIALSCGFTDQAHLCRLFRQIVGQSPAAWRRERRESAAGRGRTAEPHGKPAVEDGPIGPRAPQPEPLRSVQ
ncbi:MAG: AraC family transcriptional regulator [Rhizomicrobium sp.]